MDEGTQEAGTGKKKESKVMMDELKPREIKWLWLKKVLCFFKGHNETIWRQQKDQRVLLWVCDRCDVVTRSLKMNHKQMKLFRAVKRVH